MDLCRSCGRPFSPTHDVDAPGPTSRHPFLVAQAASDPYGRQVGESYKDACARMLGQLRAQSIDLERLQAMERRAEECSTWCGEDGMHRAVRYIQTGETGP